MQQPSHKNERQTTYHVVPQKRDVHVGENPAYIYTFASKKRVNVLRGMAVNHQ
jgi:hypothetical protein